MLLVIAALVFGVYLYRKNLRIEGASARPSKPVRAYVDGKPVDSYVKE